MSQWRRLIWPVVWSIWSILIVLQIILSFFLHNEAGLPALRLHWLGNLRSLSRLWLVAHLYFS
jgi:hypothetical protein